MDDLKERFQAACAVVEEAAELARRRFSERDIRAFELKGAQDYFTEADGEIERLIVQRLAESFPDDGFLGEEGGETGGAGGEQPTWVIDPIDGTANFARGMPHFSISIALVRGGEPAVGLVCDPMARELFAGYRGGGARLNGVPIGVSGVTNTQRATVELGWSLRRPMSDYLAMVARVTQTGAGFIRGGSGALGLAYVAAGRLDGYAELHINAWDCLAGILLVEEAGGWVSDFLADEGLVRGNALLACTPGLRAALVDASGIGA